MMRFVSRLLLNFALLNFPTYFQLASPLPSAFLNAERRAPNAER
jgi:hypothetical protein